MGIKVGDVDVAKDIIEIRHQLIRTQLILEAFINANPNMEKPSIDDMEEINENAAKILMKHYPNMVSKNV